MISISNLCEKLKGEKRVALICHVRPDGDSFGSALALKFSLETLGILAEVVCDDTVPSRFLFLNEIREVKNVLSGEYSALIAVDCADINRTGGFAEQFLAHKNTYNIDHHVSNTRYAKTNYVVDTASNSENILNIITELKVPLNKSIANLLAMGVMTDTGNFHHKNVTENTMLATARLVGAGADLNLIYFYMFTAQSKERAKLFGLTMSKIRYFHDGRLAMATVTQKDIELACAKPDETEGFIDFVMGILGVEVGVCLMEMSKNKYKVSFRSKSSDVNAVAGTFGGGGHTLASGCQIQGEYEEVVDRLQFAVSRVLVD